MHRRVSQIRMGGSIENKKGPSLVEAFKIILASGRKPEKIITDQGTEFFNKHFKALLRDEDIKLYNTYNETKSFCCGTLDTYAENKDVAILYDKENHAIHRHVTGISVNHTMHRSIKKKPADITVDNEKQVWHMLYDDHDEVKHVI